MHLAELEADAQLDVPRDIGHQIKMLAADPRYALAWRFIVHDLGCARKLSYVPGRPDPAELMIWREGRRFVGEQLLRMVEEPIPDETPEEPPARTMTERALRRAAKEVNKGE